MPIFITFKKPFKIAEEKFIKEGRDGKGFYRIVKSEENEFGIKQLVLVCCPSPFKKPKLLG